MALSFSLLGLAVLAVWLPAIPFGQYRVASWPLLLAAALAAGSLNSLITPAGLLAIAALAVSCLLSRESNAISRRVFTTGAALLALALALHLVPGFNNPIVIDAVRISSNGPSFTQYASFDKASAGLLVLAFFCVRSSSSAEWRKILAPTFTAVFATSFLVMTLAVVTGYVAFDPKVPSVTPIFLLVNLLFTCVAEEAFFRGLIQEGILRAQPRARWIAVMISAVLFGVAHWGGGMLNVTLATFAGFGYAVVYDRTRRIEAAVLTHFAVNVVHFLGFTYPRLLT